MCNNIQYMSLIENKRLSGGNGLKKKVNLENVITLLGIPNEKILKIISSAEGNADKQYLL